MPQSGRIREQASNAQLRQGFEQKETKIQRFVSVGYRKSEPDWRITRDARATRMEFAGGAAGFTVE